MVERDTRERVRRKERESESWLDNIIIISSTTKYKYATGSENQLAASCFSNQTNSRVALLRLWFGILFVLFDCCKACWSSSSALLAAGKLGGLIVQ